VKEYNRNFQEGKVWFLREIMHEIKDGEMLYSNKITINRTNSS